MFAKKLIWVGVCLLTISACGGGGSSAAGASGPSGSGTGTSNNSPIANAGTDFLTFEQEDAELVGSGSDSDGSIQSYSWQQTSGPTVALETPTDARSLFATPDVSTQTQLEFTLTVTDDDGATSSDGVTVTVEPLVGISGIISADTMLDGAYEVTADLQVAPNVTLTIMPGSLLRFAVTTELIVAGTLIVDGTVAEPVFFSYLQLANNPEQSWGGIHFEGSPNSSITNAVIENALNGVNLDGTSVVPITGSVFRGNYRGITDHGNYQPMQVSGNTFVNNFDALSGIRTSGSSSFSSNLFVDNPEVFKNGYYFGTTMIESNSFVGATMVITAPEIGYGYGTVIATGNWWGTTVTAEIAELIVDSYDDVTLQEVIFTPFLDEMPVMVGSAIASDIALPAP